MPSAAPAHAIRPKLSIREKGCERRSEIAHVPFTIGRRNDQTLILDDHRVSREHAVIDINAGGYFIRDSHSRHGTFVNGARVTQAQLHSGDTIRLGCDQVELVFDPIETRSATRAFITEFANSPASSDIEKLALFLQAARTLSNSAILQEVFTTLIEYGIKVTGAERGFVFVNKGDSLNFACGLDRTGNSLCESSDISHSVLAQAARNASEFIISDTTELPSIDQRLSIVANSLRSVIAIPLRSHLRRSDGDGSRDGSLAAPSKGVLYLDSHNAGSKLTRVSHDVLRAMAEEATALVINAELVAAGEISKATQKELEIAAAIQRSILSAESMTVPFASVRARTQPCHEVGGDFYEIIATEHEVTALVVDVSGKGVSAALLACILEGMVVAQITAGVGLAQLASSANTFLCARLSGEKYATLAAATLRCDGQVEILNCGHVSPLIARADGSIEIVRHGDLPVGLFCDATFQSITLQLKPGERLLLLSDGVTESENSDEVQFGLDRVSACLHSPDPLAQIFSSLNLFCGAIPAGDDCTALLLECGLNH